LGMHRSRLAGFIIDCQTDDLDSATQFWSAALGMAAIEREEESYDRLDSSARDMEIEVQRVAHPSRVHLDVETDDIDAEVARLEALGAKKVQFIQRWWVMEAPTGQRFCVIRAKRSLAGAAGVNVWT
jgi:catechol 2,3-dioxygenase-like lactoylglutathione lyase family enzyme